MAVLSDETRAEIVAEAMRSGDCPGAITKPQLRAMVNAMDDWWETVAAAGNTAIPQPQRGLCSQKEKAALFTRILNERYKVA